MRNKGIHGARSGSSHWHRGQMRTEAMNPQLIEAIIGRLKMTLGKPVQRAAPSATRAGTVRLAALL